MLHKFYKIIVLVLVAIFVYISPIYLALSIPSPSLPLNNNIVEKQNSISNQEKQKLDSKNNDDLDISTDNDVSEQDSFIDLGDKKLPTLQNSVYEQLNTPTKHNQQDKEPTSTVVPANNIQDVSKSDDKPKTNNIVTPQLPIDNDSQSTQKLKPSSTQETPPMSVPVVPANDIQDVSKPDDTSKTNNIVTPQLPIDNDSQSTQKLKPPSTQETPPVPVPVVPTNNIQDVSKPDDKPKTNNIVTPQLPIDNDSQSTQKLKPSSTQETPPVPVPAVPANNIQDASKPDDKPKTSNIVTPLSKKKESKSSSQDNILQEEHATKSKDSTELNKFVKDETQMLLLPNDDIILGELVGSAKLEQMDIYSYINLVKQEQEKVERLQQRKVIDNFIKNYNNKFNDKNNSRSSNVAINTAFKAVLKGDLSVLRIMIDNYPILQKSNCRNYTLLHKSVEVGNYYLTKFLIMRGINLEAVNLQLETALMIAEKENNNNIICLLKKSMLNAPVFYETCDFILNYR